MKKIVFLLGCLTFFSFVVTTKVYAEEASPSPDNSVIYDIDQGGLQQFEVEDDLGEHYIITVEEEPEFFMRASSVNNGTYKITKERALQWKVSYKIDVKGNNITKAHSPSITNYIGSVLSSSLKVDHTKQATYYIKMKILTINSSVNVRAKLQNSSIVVTY
ncbi:DUF5626 family protein [Desemzia sp. RIT804]|uniref:DUF5626 family protein n=1 Tax=Desemzia sp. RIT 804 TaxID=2810209 RepID=UPI00194F239E|nr:DUF5626 family protein [Desemzia sp. RIT 804]MBM6615812.1 DUF5626 family protein [Desemzia sp. RIT 804]